MPRNFTEAGEGGTTAADISNSNIDRTEAHIILTSIEPNDDGVKISEQTI